MSKKLNKAERNCTVTELECMAVVLAIKKFRMYTDGHSFKVGTNHSSLRCHMNQSDLSGRLARWAIKLQGYLFESNELLTVALSHQSSTKRVTFGLSQWWR